MPTKVVSSPSVVANLLKTRQFRPKRNRPQKRFSGFDTPSKCVSPNIIRGFVKSAAQKTGKVQPWENCNYCNLSLSSEHSIHHVAVKSQEAICSFHPDGEADLRDLYRKALRRFGKTANGDPVEVIPCKAMWSAVRGPVIGSIPNVQHCSPASTILDQCHHYIDTMMNTGVTGEHC